MAIEHAERNSLVPGDAFELPPTLNIRCSAVTICDAPGVGDFVENCRLIAQLGRGSAGRVFLAQQPALANRPIVLKITADGHDEHLNLARLQHTHIMPLYWASSDPDNEWRILAMPFLGKTTLACLLDRLHAAPLESWSGERALAELQLDQADLPIQITPQEHTAQCVKELNWVDFVLRMGRTLAEALAFAHQRNLLHLDVKPSNILIAPDGHPILLDLDVARQPVAAGTTAVSWFGGTPAYMSPEQRLAMQAVALDQPIPVCVDERSDIYSLGVVLFVALGGELAAGRIPDAARLADINPHVNREVAGIVARCLAEDSAARYPTCAVLAEDLERQLHDMPLIAVRERWSDRWRKWRRRRPLVLPMFALAVCFCAVSSFWGVGVQQANSERRSQAEAALLEGQELQRLGHHEAAIRRYSTGKEIAAQTYGAGLLSDQLARRVRSGQRVQFAQELKQTVRMMRFDALEDHAPRRMQHVLEAAGRKIWQKRAILTERSAEPLDPLLERRIDDEIQELIVLWSNLQMRLVPPTHARSVRAEVQMVITEAEQQFGLSFAVRVAKMQHGLASVPARMVPTRTWEHCAMGRIALRDGDLSKAESCFQEALTMDPADPDCNLHVAVQAMRRNRFADALPALSFCLGAEPIPECFVLRGETYAGLDKNELALADFNHAIARNPELARGFQGRSSLYTKMGRLNEARADLERAKSLDR